MTLYRLVYLLLKTFVVVMAPLLSEKAKRWIAMRSTLQLKFQSLDLNQAIWVHASSGEIEYAKSLIKDLKARFPQDPIVVTYSSESAEKLFENIKDKVDLFLPLPWDDRYSMNLLIQKLSPKILIISRTDLWPEMIQQCANRNIPIALISYFPSLGSGGFWLKHLLNKLNFISCVDTAVENWVKSLICNRKTIVQTDGDTRFDQVFIRLEQPTKIVLPSDEKILTLGSTWPEDEAQVHELMAAAIRDGYKIILSPHDISENRLHAVQLWLREKGFSYRFLSHVEAPITFNFQVLVIDQIGYLADAYRYSDLAFVGGSFKSRVHSVMEPLACGLPVFVGPHYQNNPEALRYSIKPKYIFTAENAKELLEAYKKITSQNLPALKAEIRNEMQKNKGATKKIADFIQHNLLKKEDS
jgi:3-deoxy-D-manno-octulosonic-acid transferase